MQEKNWFISVLVFELYGPLLYGIFHKNKYFSLCVIHYTDIAMVFKGTLYQQSYSLN